MTEETRDRSGPSATPKWIAALVRAYWLMFVAVGLVWMVLWVVAVVGPTTGRMAGVSMIAHSYRGRLAAISLNLFAIGLLVSVVRDWRHGWPPWAIFFPRRYGRPSRYRRTARVDPKGKAMTGRD